MITLIAAAELSLAFGVGQGHAATHDRTPALSARISELRDAADPFLVMRTMFVSCGSSAVSECHRSEAVAAGLRFHLWSTWLGLDLGAGIGRIAALRGPAFPMPDKPTRRGDLIPVLGGGLDARIPLTSRIFARVDLALYGWPSAPGRALIETSETAGIGASF